MRKNARKSATAGVRAAVSVIAALSSTWCDGAARPDASVDAEANVLVDARSEVVLTCDLPLLMCGEACVNPARDPANCGACGVRCESTATTTASCEGGGCRVACAPGFADCDGTAANGCETALSNDAAHCGACGVECPNEANAEGVCSGGTCGLRCAEGFGDCDSTSVGGCESAAATDRENCGACGRACPWPSRSDFTCAAGACRFACRAGYADCDGVADNGCEVSLGAARNCGACGSVCSGATPVCDGGRCVERCPEGTTDCEGTCVDTQANLEHCGACGVACTGGVNAQGACGGGRCGVECRPGYANCDGDARTGCEIFLAGSEANCGACGRACPDGVACVGGMCRCPAGDARCTGGCGDTTSSAANCGACGNACGPGQRCVTGVCREAYPEQVSVATDGARGELDSFLRRASVSADGRYVAFSSRATNLVAGDTNNAVDVFVRDLATGTTTRVSQGLAGAQPDGDSDFAAISENGRFVAFRSAATNLVAGDTNRAADIFVFDRTTGATERVSVGAMGAQGNGDSTEVALSADGAVLVFRSAATNLVTGDTNNATDIFVRDRGAGTTTRASASRAGVQGDGDSYAPTITANGRLVAFGSDATNLVTGDTNGLGDVFLRDVMFGTVERVGSLAVQPNGASTAPSISSDGRYTAIESSATNLVTGDTNARADVFVFDRQTRLLVRADVGPTGAQVSAGAGAPSLSSDGRYVAFVSTAADLVAGDTNGVADVFVRGLQSNTTARVSVDAAGQQADNASSAAWISPDGRFVAFASTATNLAPGDARAAADVFVTRAR